MARPLEKPRLEYGNTYSPGRRGLGDSYMDEPRRSPPRPASVGSPGRIADLSSIRINPGDGMFCNNPLCSSPQDAREQWVQCTQS